MTTYINTIFSHLLTRCIRYEEGRFNPREGIERFEAFTRSNELDEKVYNSTNMKNNDYDSESLTYDLIDEYDTNYKPSDEDNASNVSE